MTQKLTRLAFVAVLVAGCVLAAAWHAAALCALNWEAIAQNSTAVAGVLGFGVGCVVFLRRPLFVRVNVFFHEMNHILAAILVGRKVRRLRIGRRGGSVQVERPNAFIALAPYVIPLAPMVLAGILLPLWMATGHGALLSLGAAAVAASFAWHLSHTVFSLCTGQSDFKHAGTVISGAVIIAANVAILYWGVAAMEALAPDSNVVVASESAGRAIVSALK